MSLRTFIAVEVGPLDEILKFEQDIRTSGGAVKLVEPENIHITLKFLGNTDEELVNDIVEILRECCSGIKSFKLRLKGAGVFPNLNYIKILWIGLQNYEPLEIIAKNLDSKLNKLGFKSEKRAFRPHITVGRVKSRKNKSAIKELVLNNKDRDFGELNINSVLLKKSVLDSTGPTYYTLGTAELE
jgi:2'-5' RNA ligase